MNHSPADKPGGGYLSFILLTGYGALSLAAQVIILREFLALAQGNEVFLGLGLWAWLIWTGLGSLLGGRLAGRQRVGQAALLQLLIWQALSLPLTVILIRALPTLAGWTTGVAPAPVLLGFWYILLSLPFCFFSGLFFPLTCSWLQTKGNDAGVVGRAYGLDALGMAMGGILLQVLLLGRWDSLWLALGLGLGMAGLMFWFLGAPFKKPWIPLLILLLAGGGILAGSARLPEKSRHWQWPQRTLLAVAETPYSVWAATREAEQTSLAANGLWYFSYPDPQSAEEQVHYALLQHQRPERVLLLGSGVAGLAGEILKSPGLTRLDYVELDPRLITLAKDILPPAARRPFQDQRLRVSYEDGRRFVRHSRDYYDVIIMALPEPKCALLNRYYTREFFAEAKARLTAKGVFSFGLPGSEISLSPMRARYLGTAAATLNQVFPEVMVLPGLTWRFFASPQTGSLSPDPGVWLSRRQARGLDLLYIRDYYLTANFSPARQAYARNILARPGADLNTDLQPQGLFYGLVLTGGETGGWLARGLLWLKQTGSGVIYLGLASLTLLLLAARYGAGSGGQQLLHLYCVLTMGLTVMALEMVVLILFQTALGYLYGQLGLLLAGFMAGLAGGAFFTGSRLDRGVAAGTVKQAAIMGQGLLGLLMLILGVSLPWLLGQPYLQEDGWGQVFFTGVLVGAGLLSGGIFALQADLSRRQGAALSLSAGRLYAVDLLGATLGTLGMSFFIIPCFGPAQALYLGATGNASALLLLLSARPENSTI